MGPAEIAGRILANVKSVIVGKDQQIVEALCCWIAGGHLLIEDVPGTGKTILARAIAKSVNVPFNRVQFTPDLLPSDIVGSSVYRQTQGEFEFKKGPLFTSVLLADEINRATPRTQSALLEAMSEGQVSADGSTYQLDPLFFTIATQNPLDQLGTFALPEAQLDRFMMKISMGYPTREEEVNLVKGQNQQHPIHALQPVETAERLTWIRRQLPEIRVGEEIYDYVMTLLGKTRQIRELRLGASPRATVALIKASQALAMCEGQTFVSPQHITQLIRLVLCHRLMLTAEAKMAGLTTREVVDQIVKSTPVPMRKK
jgi:MoxR-like ATPase